MLYGLVKCCSCTQHQRKWQWLYRSDCVIFIIMLRSFFHSFILVVSHLRGCLSHCLCVAVHVLLLARFPLNRWWDGVTWFRILSISKRQFPPNELRKREHFAGSLRAIHRTGSRWQRKFNKFYLQTHRIILSPSTIRAQQYKCPVVSNSHHLYLCVCVCAERVLRNALSTRRARSRGKKARKNNKIESFKLYSTKWS